MALTLADAVVFIRGNTDTLDKDLQGAEKSTTKFFGSFSSAVNTLMAGAIAGGAAAATAALVKVGTTAVNVAFEMDSLERKFTQTLGVSKDRAAELGDLVQNVYVRGLGGTLTDVSEALTLVNQGLGDLALSDTAIEEATANALLLRDAFEIDVAESVRTVSILLKSGLAPDAETAFNIITAGMQEGLNISDDFLDTLNEYADDFARLGFTADQTLGLINAGLDAGIFNTDKIGDLMNEFGIRIREVDTGKLADIDADIAGIIRSFQGGELSEADAFKAIIDRLNEMEDPIERNRIGVELFGSMWEDLGEKAVLALGDFDSASITTDGRIEELQRSTDSLSTRFDRLKRRGEVALEPLGEQIIGLLEQGFPLLESAVDGIMGKTNLWGATFTLGLILMRNLASGLYNKLLEFSTPLDTFINNLEKGVRLAQGLGVFTGSILGLTGGGSDTAAPVGYNPNAGSLSAGSVGVTGQLPPRLGATDQFGNPINSQSAGGPTGGFGYDATQMYPNSFNSSPSWLDSTGSSLRQNINIVVQRGATDDDTGNTLSNIIKRKGGTP